MNKFANLIIGSLVLVAVLSLAVEAQQRQPRARGSQNARNKPKGKADQCHGKEVDKCFEQLQAYNKADRPSEIIKTREGLDKLCKSFGSTVECQRGYIKKCATPLQKELFDFFLESFTKGVEEFCDSPESKQKLLVHSPCLSDKVFETPDYKAQCIDPFLTSVDYINSTTRVTQDDKYDTACCGFTQWQKCAKDKIIPACGKEANESFEQYILNTFGGFNGQVCPDDVFAITSATCKKALPPPTFKSKGKLSDSPLTQFVAIYFGFLFSKGAN